MSALTDAYWLLDGSVNRFVYWLSAVIGVHWLSALTGAFCPQSDVVVWCNRHATLQAILCALRNIMHDVRFIKRRMLHDIVSF